MSWLFFIGQLVGVMSEISNKIEYNLDVKVD